MAKQYIAFISAMLLLSCGARKVDIAKLEVKSSLDSSSVVSVDIKSIKENNIATKDYLEELEYIPSDTSKPMVINGRKYINTIIRLKKKEKNTKDNTKTIETLSFTEKIKLNKDNVEKKIEKKIDRKQNNLVYLWFIVLFFVVLAIYRYRKVFYTL